MSVHQDLAPVTFAVKNVMNIDLIFNSSDLWIEITADLNITEHDYSCTSSMMGQPTFYLSCD